MKLSDRHSSLQRHFPGYGRLAREYSRATARPGPGPLGRWREADDEPVSNRPPSTLSRLGPVEKLLAREYSRATADCRLGERKGSGSDASGVAGVSAWKNPDRRHLAQCGFGVVLFLAVLTNRLIAAEPDRLPIRLFLATSLEGWTAQTQGTNRSWESSVWSPSFAWNEAVPSWNVTAGSAWSIELKAVGPNQTSEWFPLGHWCSNTNRAPRTSSTSGAFAGGRVLTDTLRLNQPATGIQIRLTPGPHTTAEDLRLFAVNLLDTQATWIEPAPWRTAWGHELAVPLRSQAEFPEGVNSWCSPSCVTMLLTWWQEKRRFPSEPITVPEVALGVYDPGWPGTGNWAFNMAYAGQTPGLRSTVARLAGLADLERWLAADLPVATSVSYAVLQERAVTEPGDGHLVVVRGFTATGDVLINDPGVRLSRGHRVVARAAFQRAWQHSHYTAYLIWSSDTALPTGSGGRW